MCGAKDTPISKDLHFKAAYVEGRYLIQKNWAQNFMRIESNVL